mmetsp:Transcript_1285/g.2939  ORF Transcript_1285/g.2939 Transcript_1285/m.2939 type:complete len:214 (-) Transcript_1285:331-972(-)
MLREILRRTSPSGSPSAKPALPKIRESLLRSRGSLRMPLHALRVHDGGSEAPSGAPMVCRSLYDVHRSDPHGGRRGTCLATSRRGRFAMLRHRMSRRRDLGRISWRSRGCFRSRSASCRHCLRRCQRHPQAPSKPLPRTCPRRASHGPRIRNRDRSRCPLSSPSRAGSAKPNPAPTACHSRRGSRRSCPSRGRSQTCPDTCHVAPSRTLGCHK